MANTLKFGGGTWATKKGSTLAYNDENEKYKPLPFSFERDSIATRVNKEGLIEVVGKDIPRIDYTDSTEGVLLLENSSTNKVTYSEDFNNSYWTKNGSSVTSGFSSPNGENNAFKLIEDLSNGNHRIDAQGISITSGVSQTFSMFFKYDGSVEWVRIREFGINAFVYCNIKNNIFGATNKVNNSEKIEDFGNGWKRISFTYTSTTQGANFRIYLADGDNVDGYQGDGSSGVYIWGAMLEQNSVASSYIPTNGSSVQRAAETANDSGNSEVFNDSQGVLFANVISNGGTTDGYISISDLTINNRLAIRIGYNNSNKVSLFMVSNGGSSEFEEFYDVGSLGFSNFNKFALKYKVNDVSLFFNGFEVITISSAAMASGFKSLNFANATNGTQPFYGKTKEIGYYDTALTDEELEYLTSYRSLNELVTELNLNAL